MKSNKIVLSRFLTFIWIFCMLLLFPIEVNAAQPVPAGGITTTLSDSRYIDQAWMNQIVTISYNGQSWLMGINSMAAYPVYLNDDAGVRQCVIGETQILDVFLNAINEQLKNMAVTDSAVSIFDNGAGSYIQNAGQTYFQLNSGVKAWMITVLQQQFAAGSPQGISLDLTAEYLTPVVVEPKLMYSSDYVLSGTSVTSFSGSSSNRINNLKVSAARLNDMVIMPGQTVSVSDTILPRTADNGYKSAGAYLNGETVQALGGGICQLSSTVYNAVMNAGLPVVERHPHSMPVYYLPLGQDAAISAGTKDLRFRNDYSAPIILQAYTEGKKLIINVLVWDQDLNGRTFKLWAKKTSGLFAKTYLTTYQDGAEVSTVTIGNSSYMAPKKKTADVEDD